MRRTFRCPMCGGEIQLAAGHCLNCGEKYLPTDAEVAEVRRVLKQWVIRRAGIAFGVIFGIPAFTHLVSAIGSTRAPGWDALQLFSILGCALLASLLIGSTTALRAWWFLQEVDAIRAGMSPERYLGQWIGRVFRRQR